VVVDAVKTEADAEVVRPPSKDSPRPIHPARAAAWGVVALGCGFGFLAAPTATGKIGSAAVGLFATWRSSANLDFF
jgi:hypothetical protein